MKFIPTIKDFFNSHFSLNTPLEYRICYIMCICGDLADIMGVISTFVLGLPSICKIIALISLAVMSILTIIGFNTKKPDIFAATMTIIIGNIVFPLMFITEGGLEGGMPYYFLLSPICYAYTMKKRPRYLLILCSILEYGILFHISYTHPEYLFQLPKDAILPDMISGISVVFLFLFFFSDQFARHCAFEQKQVEYLSELYQHQANTDENTGLFNRRYFKSLLLSALSNIPSGAPFYLAMFDIDDFKKINDEYGHLFGDKVLKRFASILADEGTKGNIASCRYGGEEFLLLFQNITESRAYEITENILKRAKTEILCGSEKTPVTVSAGFLTCTSEETYESVLQAVDIKLYHAKKNGKDRIVQ